MKFVFLGLFLFVSFSVNAENTLDQNRQIIHTLDYISKDYSGAVADGKVIEANEYREQLEFIKNAEKLGTSTSEKARLSNLRKLIESKGTAHSVSTHAREIISNLLKITPMTLAPAKLPDLEKGKSIYAQSCAVCHGERGFGDGAGGVKLDPKPANFHDLNRFANAPPFGLFNTVHLGVTGTGMPAFNYSEDDTWAVTYYVLSFSHSERDLVATLNRSDSLQIALKNVEAAKNSFLEGQFENALQLSTAAYLDGIEPVERKLRATNPDLVVEIENVMFRMRTEINQHVDQTVFLGTVENAKTLIGRAQQTIADSRLSRPVVFTMTSSVILREGFEAALVLIALFAMVRAARSRKAAIAFHIGWSSAVVLGFLTWILSGWLIEISGAGREMLEGITSLFAVAILLYMGFWLHSQSEIKKWKSFIDSNIHEALATKNILTLGSMAFLAVYREAFETILFLQTIALEGGPENSWIFGIAIVSSLALLIALISVIVKFSIRLPIGKLFTVFSWMLAILAMILVGQGLHSLQEAGILSATQFLSWLRLSPIGVYPTIETSSAQILVLGIALGLWYFGNKYSPSKN